MSNDAKRERAVAATRKARDTAHRSMDRTTLRPVVKEYEELSGGFVMRLGRLMRGQTREQASPRAVSKIVGAFNTWMGETYTALDSTLRLGTRLVLDEGIGTTARVFRQVMQSGSSLDSIVTAQKLVMMREAQLASLRSRAFVDAQTRTQADVLARLKGIVAEQRPVSELVTSVGEALDGHLWEVERTVRTETNFAWNAAQSDGIRAIGDDYRGVFQRWTEMVNDLTGAPLDSKVAADSMAMHGQLTMPGQPFVMPASAKAPPKLIGKSWYHPPNRPNDRAVLTPWMRDWGIPGWQVRGARRIHL